MLQKLTIIGTVLVAMTYGQDRLQTSADVLRQIVSAPDRSPAHMLSKASCVMVIPGMKKGAAIVGADHGRGYAVCRHEGKWGGPAAITLSGGSVGAQLGVKSTDLVLLVMNEKGMQRLEKDKLTLGTDASVAAGPTGRTASAQTDISMRAEILSYSRSHGAFAGLAIEGAVLRRDDAEDQKLYGRHVTNGQIIRGEVAAPASASVLTSALNELASTGSN